VGSGPEAHDRRVTPDDLATVQRSWAQLRLRRAVLLDALTAGFADRGATAVPPDARASWLLGAVEELVGLLATPSALADHARELGSTWPDPCTAPSYAVEGTTWQAAARACLPTWTERTGAAWQQAWLLLSDVLAAEALSPFADPPSPTSDLIASDPTANHPHATD
jgi:hypothetical protein